MLRKLYVLLGSCLLSLQAFGQQDPQFSFFMFTPTYLNPAAVGSEGVTRIQLIHRSQWAGYQTTSGAGGSPTTQLLTASLPLARINSGVGIYAFNDAIGPQSNQSLQLAYAYRLPLKNGTLALGVQAGLYNKRIDYSGIILPTTVLTRWCLRGNIRSFSLISAPVCITAPSTTGWVRVCTILIRQRTNWVVNGV